ncbi:MAG: acetyl-CoA carboxylase biotin carboxyl carrier protein subunit [Sphingobacteriaceae bacterium]
MYKVKVNGKFDFELQPKKSGWQINGNEISTDTFVVKDNMLHILHNNKSYLAEIVAFEKETKTATIKVNGNSYNLVIKDQFDDLLHQLGLDNLQSNKVAELKAPMPGLVLNLMVKEGDIVSKGDNLFVLEAMKMENIIKSPADVQIKSIKIKPGDKVEKNQVLILFQ